MTTKPETYGLPKSRYWTMRSDRPRSTNSITSGTVYIVPCSIDAITHLFNSTANVRFKFSHEVTNNGAPGAGSWSMSLYVGLYRMYKGTAGASDTLKKWGSVQYAWSGLGNLASTTRYDPTGAVTTASTPASQRNLVDGTYYIGMLWVFTSTKLGSSHTAMAYGGNVSSGTWLYLTSGSTGNTSLPTTINALGGSAKTFQELLIWED